MLPAGYATAIMWSTLMQYAKAIGRAACLVVNGGPAEISPWLYLRGFVGGDDWDYLRIHKTVFMNSLSNDRMTVSPLEVVTPDYFSRDMLGLGV